MNDYERMRRIAQRTKAEYPPGTRLVVENMNDPYAPVPPGTKGTVLYVDDIGQIGMKWDNGRSLSIVPGEDSFRRLTAEELTAEKKNQPLCINGELTALVSGDDKSFMGYETAGRWNGWKCPLFPKASVDEMVKHFNDENVSMKYDESNDRYIVEYSQDGTSESFEGANYIVNGNLERLYSIGCFSWTWEVSVPEENESNTNEDSFVIEM